MSDTSDADLRLRRVLATHYVLGFEAAEDHVRNVAGAMFAHGDDERAATYREVADMLAGVVAKMQAEPKKS